MYKRQDYSGSGTTFSNVQSGWANIVPTTPAGANIFTAPVRYQVGVAGQTVEGVILSGTVPGSVTPPPSNTMTYTNGITYGLSDDSNNPVGTALQSDAFTLAVGQTHTTEVLDLPRTTVTGDNWYVTLPAGLTLTSVRDTVEGEVLDDWARTGMTQMWVYAVGFARGQNDMSFTVRRDT